MTVPRELKLVKVDATYFIAAEPVSELNKLKIGSVNLNNISVKGSTNLTKVLKQSDKQYKLHISSKQLNSFSITLTNSMGEQLVVGYDNDENNWYIDRTKAGISDFNKNFAKRIATRRIASGRNTDMTLVVDAASVELFTDKGLTVMTCIFFPHKPYDKIVASSPGNFVVDSFSYSPLKSIWH